MALPAKKQKKLDRILYDGVKANSIATVTKALAAGANPRAPCGKKGMCALDRLSKSKKPSPQMEFLLRDITMTGERPLSRSDGDGEAAAETSSQHAFKIGDTVTLTEDYTEYGEAMYGPLNPGNLGEVIRINVDSEDSFQVKSSDGDVFWYPPEALMLPESTASERIAALADANGGANGTASIAAAAAIAAAGRAASKQHSADRSPLDKAADEVSQKANTSPEKKSSTTTPEASANVELPPTSTQTTEKPQVGKLVLPPMFTRKSTRKQKMFASMQAELSEALKKERSAPKLNSHGSMSRLAAATARSVRIQKKKKSSRRLLASSGESGKVESVIMHPEFQPPKPDTPPPADARADEPEELPEFELDLPSRAQASKKTWELPRKQLELGEQIGEGMFGKVYSGFATGIPGTSGKRMQVAIKSLSSDAKDVEDDFFKEVDIMKALDGPHKIVRLLAVVTSKKPYYMVLQFMAEGDLKTVLRRHRPKKKAASTFSMRKLTEMAVDVAEGMAYLASKKIVHRDLAARNCLVDEIFSCRVGDFGLTRDVYQQEYYRMTGSAPLPIRWMSPEALMDGVSTSASDVWSFGVVLWELVTFAKLPYGVLSNMEVCEKVTEDDYRMPCPKGCPTRLYAIMRSCWIEDADERPAFADLATNLAEAAKEFDPEPIQYQKKGAAALLAEELSVPPEDTGQTTAPQTGLEDYGETEALTATQITGLEDYGETEALTATQMYPRVARVSQQDVIAGYMEPQDSTSAPSPTGYEVPQTSNSEVTDLPSPASPTGYEVPQAIDAKAAEASDSSDDEEGMRIGGYMRKGSSSEPALYPQAVAAGVSDFQLAVETAAASKQVTQVELPPATATGRVVEAKPSAGVALPPGGMEEDVVPWMEKLLGGPIGVDFHANLRSGEKLCALVNAIQPGIVPKPHNGSKMAFKQMENCGWFLEAASSLGVANSDLFATTDLFEGTNMKQVLICLNALRLKWP